MDGPANDPGIDPEDLENERPGFTPAGRKREGAEARPSTRDRRQPSALGGDVATRSKLKQED